MAKLHLILVLNFIKKIMELKGSFKFSHGVKYHINGLTIFGCYHPSPRNVNTKRINETKMINLFKKAKKLI